jgi:hypothetical protein
MNALLHFFLVNGIGQNLTASLILGAPAVVFGRRHLKRLHAKLDQLHRHLGVKGTEQ